MSIQGQLIEFATKHSLKEKAFASINKVMDASIKSDNEFGIDFLDGHDKADLIYEFGRFEFQLDKNDWCRIVTRVNIYSKELYGPNYNAPVGYYEEWTDLTGEHLDEFLIFDWSPINFNIDYHIERINKVVPQSYFKRNIPEYEFATYVNHIISLFQGRQFDGTIVFVKRCLAYLEKPENKEIEKEYLNECLDLFRGLFHFIKNKELVKAEKLSEYRIDERIKTRSQQGD